MLQILFTREKINLILIKMLFKKCSSSFIYITLMQKQKTIFVFFVETERLGSFGEKSFQCVNNSIFLADMHAPTLIVSCICQ